MFLNSCRQCPYHEQSKKRVNIINKDKDCLILMLCPGKNEIENGKPLCSDHPSSATQRMKNALDELGKSFDDFAITEVVKCYPGAGDERDNEPNLLSYFPCSRLLIKELKKGKYKKVIAFGEQPRKIIKALKEQYRFDFEIVECGHPTGGTSSEEIKNALK